MQNAGMERPHAGVSLPAGRRQTVSDIATGVRFVQKTFLDELLEQALARRRIDLPQALKRVIGSSE
jgi:hypothetical protein